MLGVRAVPPQCTSFSCREERFISLVCLVGSEAVCRSQESQGDGAVVQAFVVSDLAVREDVPMSAPFQLSHF